MSREWVLALVTLVLVSWAAYLTWRERQDEQRKKADR